MIGPFVGLIGAVMAIGTGLVLLSIVGIVLAVFLGIGVALLVKVVPILLVGWVVLKLIEGRSGRSTDQLTAADRRWLER